MYKSMSSKVSYISESGNPVKQTGQYVFENNNKTIKYNVIDGKKTIDIVLKPTSNLTLEERLTNLFAKGATNKQGSCYLSSKTRRKGKTSGTKKRKNGKGKKGRLSKRKKNRKGRKKTGRNTRKN
jgi:hypothetical protein